jgi:hypothetical protein
MSDCGNGDDGDDATTASNLPGPASEAIATCSDTTTLSLWDHGDGDDNDDGGRFRAGKNGTNILLLML